MDKYILYKKGDETGYSISGNKLNGKRLSHTLDKNDGVLGCIIKNGVALIYYNEGGYSEKELTASGYEIVSKITRLVTEERTVYEMI